MGTDAMSLQTIERDEEFHPKLMKLERRFPVAETVSGTGAKLLDVYTGASSGTLSARQWISNTAGPVFTVLENVSTPTIIEYDSEMVARLIHLRDAPPARVFDTPEKMMTWLNQP
jgi:hypothetical protein